MNQQIGVDATWRKLEHKGCPMDCDACTASLVGEDVFWAEREVEVQLETREGSPP